jgi:hypothetical protein
MYSGEVSLQRRLGAARQQAVTITASFLGLTVTDGLLTSFVFHSCCRDTILLNIRAQIARWLLKQMNLNDLPDFKQTEFYI